MGIRTDPGYRLYTGACTCFPSGKVPKKLYCTIAGVVKDAACPPEWPEPRNGTFKLEYIAVNTWEYRDEDWSVRFDIAPTYTICSSGYDLAYPEFYYGANEVCIFTHESDLLPGSGFYCGGQFVVASRD